jgi:hypothetical protein
VLGVAATTATAGIIVGVVTLTGLGLKIAGIIVALAGGQLFLTVLYAAIAVWLLGLAVPVTASYIIAAVMVAPALVQSGVPPVAAHMFIFYYAVLSEVSPPTALSPFAAAALTGGNPFRTMMLTWKYTLPAFVVPFVFTLSPEGLGVLLQGSWQAVLTATAVAAVGVGALAAGFGGWMRGAASLPERGLLIGGGCCCCSIERRGPTGQLWALLLWCCSCTFVGIRPPAVGRLTIRHSFIVGYEDSVGGWRSGRRGWGTQWRACRKVAGAENCPEVRTRRRPGMMTVHNGHPAR